MILTKEQVRIIKRALGAAKMTCQLTHGETDDDEPQASAADVFEEVCNLEPLIDEALELLE